MLSLSAQQIAERAIDLNLVTDRQLQDVWGSLGTRNVAAADFRQALLRRNMLTSYQLSRLERGDRAGFYYGDYKVLYLVGSGTFARVYRAAHRVTDEMVALKVLRRRHVEDPKSDQREQFIREGEVGMSLRHENIVPIYAVGTEGRSLFLVMEFIEGSNLREFVKVRKRCAPAEAVQLMSGVAGGLDYALQRGIAHRDIKMSNVLISTRGESKLLDFGLASDKNDTDDALAACANVRTIDYAGLERACGVKRGDPRSDLYFVGCMLYHMVSGHAPLPETRDRMQRLSKTRFMAVLPVETFRPDLPRHLAAIVNRSVQLDASTRYQTPKDLLFDLQVAYGKLGEMDTILEDEGSVVLTREGVLDSKVRRHGRALRAVMFVESNLKMQEIFRQRLKRSGFRVLVTSDPDRALVRFERGEPPAACVVFSTDDLGEQALAAFSRFTHGPSTREIPAVLLLGQEQADWADRGTGLDHHVVVTMPVTLGRLREVLDRLVPGEEDLESRQPSC